MLNTRLVRTPLTRAAGLVIAVALVAITTLAGLVASAQSTTASFSGSLIDAVGRILPDTMLTLTSAQTSEKRDLTSDPAGHFAVAGLAAGASCNRPRSRTGSQSIRRNSATRASQGKSRSMGASASTAS